MFVFQSALEYERYLKEVVNALETDPEFRKKLDNATDVDIRVRMNSINVLYLSSVFMKLINSGLNLVWQNRE